MRYGMAIGFVGALAFGSVVCAPSTRFISSWKAPDAGPLNFQGQKVAALVISPESSRLEAEGNLGRELSARGMQGIPAYNLIPPNETRDKDRAKLLFNTAGIVGVVVLRAVGAEKEVSYSPSFWSAPYYGSFWGSYYGYGWSSVYDPGYLRTDTVVKVETLVYDLKADKLLWAGMSRSTNPSGVQPLIQELVTAAAAEMKKQGLIKSR